MQFLGFGFNMAAQDVGLEQSLDTTVKRMGEVNDMVDDQQKKAKDVEKKGIWAKMKEGAKSFNIASIAGNVRKLTGETGNLTSRLEGMGVANAQAAKPILATLDLTEKEHKAMVSRVSSLAIGLQVGAGEIATVFKTIRQAGEPAKKVLDELNMSEKDWVKFTSTSGIAMQDMTGVMGDLSGEWGVAPKRVAGLLNSLVEIGKKTGTGIEALKTATQVVDEFGQVQMGLAQHLRLSGDEIATATEQAYKLSGAYVQLGATEAQAVALGKDTAKMFMEQAAAYKKARSMGESLPDDNLLIQLQQMGVTESKAMEILATGEKDAVAGMMLLNEEVKKAAGGTDMHKVMLGKLAQTLGQTGQSLVWLAESSDVGAGALEKVSKMALDGKSNLKSFGDQAFTSGRTLAENFELAKDMFKQQVRGIARGNVKKLVGAQMKGYKRMGKQIKTLGSDETWGPLMHAWSTMEQMGVRGLGLAFLDKNASKGARDNAIDMGIAFESGFDALKGLGEELSPVMEILGMFGPLGPLAAMGGIAALFVMPEEDAKGILGGFYETFKGMKDMVVNVMDQIPWGDIWAKVSKTGKKVFYTLTDDIPWRQMLENAMPVIREIASALVGALGDAIKGLAEQFSAGEFALGGAIMGGIMGGMAFGPFGGLVGALAGALIAGAEQASAEAEKGLREFDQRRAKEAADAIDANKKGIAEVEKYREDKAIQTETAIAQGAKAAYEKYLIESGQSDFGTMPGDDGKDVQFALGLTGTEADFETAEFAAFAEKFRSQAQSALVSAAPATVDFSTAIGGRGVGYAVAKQEHKELEELQKRDRDWRTKNAEETVKEWGAIGTAIWTVGGYLGTQAGRGILYSKSLGENADIMNEKFNNLDAGGILDAQKLLMDQFERVQHLPQVQQTFKDMAAAGATSAEYLEAAQAAVETYSGAVEKDLSQAFIDSQTFAASSGDTVAVTMKDMARNFEGFAQILGKDSKTLLAEGLAQGKDLNGIYVQMIMDMKELTGMEWKPVSEDTLDKLTQVQAAMDSYDRTVDDMMKKDQSLSLEDAEWAASDFDIDYDQTVAAPGFGGDETGMKKPTNPVDAAMQQAVSNFASGANTAISAVSGTIDGVNATLKEKSVKLAETAGQGGKAVGDAWGYGWNEGGSYIEDSVFGTMGVVKGFTGSSLPKDGPLGGVPGSNPAFFGGRSVAEQFAEGFVSAEGYMVKEMGSAIQRLVDSLFDTYSDAMTKQMAEGGGLDKMAEKVIQSFGAKVQMGKIDADADLNLKSGKDLFKVALDKPGLVSVVTAVISSGQETQKILVAIKKNTDDLLDRPIMSKGLRFQSGTMTTAG